MSIRRTAPSSSGSHGSSSGFWTGLAAWTGLAVSLANLALLMLLWNRLPMTDLKQELGFGSESSLRTQSTQSEGLQVETEDRATVDVPPEPANSQVAEEKVVASTAVPTPATASKPESKGTTADGKPADPQPTPESQRSGIRLQVQNGSGVRLLAAKAADGLRRLRYDVRETGNAPGATAKTQIISRVEAPGPSLRLAQDLGLSSARISYNADPNLVDVDLTLILGEDYRKLPILGK